VSQTPRIISASVSRFRPISARPAADECKPLQLGRRVAAIAYAHDLAGMASPASAKLVRVVFGGIRREKGAKPVQKAPATAERITRMLEGISDTLRGKRDRALLALGFGGIRRSKTDQEGQGHEIAIPHGTQLLPVRAVQAWMQAARITDGNLFRSTGTAGSAARSPRSPWR